jgi:hypothetical protein
LAQPACLEQAYVACPIRSSNRLALHVLSALSYLWAAPHFLVHLKWEFVERSYIRTHDYIVTRCPVLLSSQDELNSLGVA